MLLFFISSLKWALQLLDDPSCLPGIIEGVKDGKGKRKTSKSELSQFDITV